MEIKIEAKKNLYVNEWDMLIVNELDHDVTIDLGHSELLVKTVTIKDDKTE